MSFGTWNEGSPSRAGWYVVTVADHGGERRLDLLEFHPRSTENSLYRQDGWCDDEARYPWRVLAWMPLPETYQP